MNATLPSPPDEILNQHELSKLTGISRPQIARAILLGVLAPDFRGGSGRPLFLLARLAQIKAVLSKL